MSDWNLRSDLELFGITLPERFNVDEWLSKLRDQPAQNTLVLVGLATALFYLAEKGKNPKVNDINDAIVYVTTNLSVGYSDIFARSMLGKIVGSILMTVGPSLAANFLNGPKQEDRTQHEMLDTLKQILARLPEPATNT